MPTSMNSVEAYYLRMHAFRDFKAELLSASSLSVIDDLETNIQIWDYDNDFYEKTLFDDLKEYIDGAYVRVIKVHDIANDPPIEAVIDTYRLMLETARTSDDVEGIVKEMCDYDKEFPHSRPLVERLRLAIERHKERTVVGECCVPVSVKFPLMMKRGTVAEASVIDEASYKRYWRQGYEPVLVG